MSGSPEIPPITEPRPARRSWRRRIARAVLLYALVPYVAVCLIFLIFQRKFLYPATRVATIRAADAGLPRDRSGDVQLSTDDGLVLHGWLVRTGRAPVRDAAHEPFLILYFPGNSGHRGDRVLDCREFSQIGCDVLLFDYRGYGDNAGSPSESGLAADAQRILAFATDELAYRPERIVVFGESIGGAVAVRLASEMCDARTPPAGLVLSSTFASLPETVRWHYPWLPFHWLLLDGYPSVERIPRVTCPVLQFHGTTDEFVPLEDARRLFAAAPSISACGVPPRLVVVAGGGHNDRPAVTFRAEMVDFLARLGHHRAIPQAGAAP